MDPAQLLSKSQLRALREDYRADIVKRVRLLSRIGSVLVLLILPYFIYEDQLVSGLPRYTTLFRAVPMALAFAQLLFVAPPLRRFEQAVPVIYYLFQGSLMAMMACFLAITAGTPLFRVFVIGTVVIVFVLFATSVHGARFLLPQYALPFAALGAYYAVTGAVHSHELIYLSNPITMAVVCAVYAQMQENTRFAEYRARRVVEMQNRRFENELKLAQSVQNSLISLEMPPVRGVTFHAVYSPMIDIGGDFFDISRVDERHLGIFIGDVSGHGVSAALIASMVKGLINTAGEHRNDPVRLLAYINKNLIGQTGGHFATAFYGLFDIESRVLVYARAGHQPPLLIREGATTELEAKGRPLGVFDDPEFSAATCRLAPGDRLLLFTDGLIESYGTDGTMFALTLPDVLASLGGRDIRSYVDGIYGRLMEHMGAERFEDDVCVIGMEIRDDPVIR